MGYVGCAYARRTIVWSFGTLPSDALQTIPSIMRMIAIIPNVPTKIGTNMGQTYSPIPSDSNKMKMKRKVPPKPMIMGSITRVQMNRFKLIP